MIRRKFMKYAPKEHSDEKVKKTLEKHNVPTFEGHQPAKFSQFGNVAKDLAAKSRKTFTTPEGGDVASAEKTFSWQQKAVYGGGTGTPGQSADPRNPYAISQPKGNPYASNPYESSSSNPYGSAAAAPPAAAAPTSASNPYGSSSQLGYGGSSSSTAYSAKSASPYRDSPGPASGSTPYSSNQYSTSSSTLGRASSHQDDAGELGQSRYDSYGSGVGAGVGAGAGAGIGGAGDTYGGAGDAYGGPAARTYGSNRYDPGYAPSRARPPQSQPSGFGEPLTRTQTNQTTSSAAIRNELFGSAPRRANPDASEFDELNRTHTELDQDDELLNTSHNLDRPQFVAPPAGIPEEDGTIDELNQLPSELQASDPQQGGSGNAGYGYGYQSSSQQLFEDSEDEDVDYVKREIRQTKQESVESTRRALQIASEAELSGRNAMGMLGDQGERLGNSANTVALGHVQARTAAQNSEELQRLNRSIFIPNVSNPFNSRRRNQLKEQRLKSEKEFDQLEREALAEQQRQSERRVAEGLNSAGFGYSETAMRFQQRANRDNPERKMYQFEADSDDEALEDELEQNLGGISDAAKRLHGLSLKINDEVTDQNKRIELMGGRVDDLDYSLHKTTAKMSTIH